ncbi:STAS domain-containing protein [Paenalkalicoccus suaedae]|uniref:STAS domain-containing protein n=1 Tax=Paenalkalicoccus suaedae TaxID=2592382 RepID=A0A859FJ88_9BACI|nr:STAS domain-containing protein [Paenalkalicoccus suaedae]QKS72666.1 STAS domain-containing protein [Paenalkalicoccus suaedae]
MSIRHAVWTQFVPAFIWVVNSDMVYIECDGIKMKESNLQRHEIIGKSISDFHKEDHSGPNMIGHRQAFDEGSSHYTVDFAGRDYEAQLYHVPDEDIVVGVAMDQTEKRELQERIRRQDLDILEYSVPLVPLLDHAVAIPIVGVFTREKASYIQSAVVTKIVEFEGVENVVIDFSGVPSITEDGAVAFNELYRVFNLLGFRTIVTGIRPGLAITVQSKNHVISSDNIYSSLKTAIKDLLQTR